jgi:histone H3/H4
MAEEFTSAPMRRLIKRFGDLRISEDATEEMRIVLGAVGLKIAERAVRKAKSEGRKTVLRRDIKNSYREVIDMGENHG